MLLICEFLCLISEYAQDLTLFLQLQRYLGYEEQEGTEKDLCR